jgi:hypothetical protein
MVAPPPVLQAALFAGSAPPKRSEKRETAPEKPAPAPYTIEVITGTKRETKSFSNP